MDHTASVCRLYYHALYACMIPTVRSVIRPTRQSLNLRYRCCRLSVSNTLSTHPWAIVFTPDAPVILMLRSYAFTGRKRPILVVLSLSFFSIVGFAVWVMSRQLDCSSPARIIRSLLKPFQKPVSALFLINERSGCFATSNQPFSGSVEAVGAYQLGVRAGLYLCV